MNIVVAMKQIPDLQQIRIRSRKPVFEGVPMTLGAIDKNALEAAVSIKESHGGKVTVLSLGNEELEDTIKEALAAGADEALLVVDEALGSAGSNIIAQGLAAAIKSMEEADLILFGEGSGDNYSGQVGSRVAAILDLPQISYASSLALDGKVLRAVCSLEEGEEIVEVNLPAVVTVISGINEPRIPSVSQILKAGRKPKQVLEAQDLAINLNSEAQIVTLSNLAPESDRKRSVLKNVGDLLQALKNENLIGR